MFALTHDLIDYHALTEAVRRPGCGAVALFLGTVRDVTGERAALQLQPAADADGGTLATLQLPFTSPP